jgi:hypothetical protein
MRRILCLCLLLAGCSSVAPASPSGSPAPVASPQPTATALPERQVLEGFYVSGFEILSFVPCGQAEEPGYGAGYWLESHPDSGFRERYEELVAQSRAADPGSSGFVTVYAKFEADVFPELPAEGMGYGHLNAYRNFAVVTRLLDMQLKPNATCGQ